MTYGNERPKTGPTGITSIREITGKRKFYKDAYSDRQAYARISGAKTNLMLENPFWGFMGLDLVLVEGPNDMLHGTLCTDGYHIIYSPKFINKLRPGEVIFAVAHEVYHCLYGHTGGLNKLNRMRAEDGFDPQLANKAQDYFINYDLKKAGVGEFIDTIQILYDPKYADMSSEQIYLDLLENGDPMSDTSTMDMHVEFELTDESDDPNAGGDEAEGEGQVSGGGSGDGDEGDQQGSGSGGGANSGQAGDGKTIKIKITADQADKEQARWEQIAQRAVAHIENDTDAAGSIPAHLRRLIADIGKPKIDWRAAMRKFVVAIRKAGYSWVRPDKRTFGVGTRMTLPGFRRDDKKLEIAVAIDTSGSISQDALNKFITELFGILKAYRQYEIHAFCFEGSVDPETYMVITGDQREAEANLKKYAQRIKGGGGTLFQSVWDFMKEKRIRPRGLVLFTDGYPCDNEWHKERMYCPSLFVTVENHDDWKSPFGMTVAYEDMGG